MTLFLRGKMKIGAKFLGCDHKKISIITNLPLVNALISLILGHVEQTMQPIDIKTCSLPTMNVYYHQLNHKVNIHISLIITSQEIFLLLILVCKKIMEFFFCLLLYYYKLSMEIEQCVLSNLSSRYYRR